MKISQYSMFVFACALNLGACSGGDVTEAETEPSATAPAAGDDTFGDDAAASTAAGAAAGVVSRDEQVAIIEQRLEATNTRDWARWESLHTPDAVRTAPELETPLRGAGAMRAAIETLSTAFPDYHLELRQAIAQGDWLAVRLHTSGTMTGPLTLSDGAVVPATGQPIEQDWTALVRFDGQHIAEFHEFYDQLALMTQLGLIAP
jgi:ketosteroid isomerase-like protein